MELILASNSPRRKELLLKAGFSFKIIPSTDEEIADATLTPQKYTEQLAFNKAKNVFDIHGNVVIGADTIVYINGNILGKPKDRCDAEKMLKTLSNKTHQVTTGYAIISSDLVIIGSETTLVTFNNLSNDVIQNYLDSNLWVGKAGSYGIQDGYNLVKEIVGDYDNVVGLPVNKIANILRERYEK